jgi:hypothetical protein
MKFVSSYEIKKTLRRRGYDLEGLQIKQVHNNHHDFSIVPLDETIRFSRNGVGFVAEEPTSDNQLLMQLMNELDEALKGSNVAIGLTSPNVFDKVSA